MNGGVFILGQFLQSGHIDMGHGSNRFSVDRHAIGWHRDLFHRAEAGRLTLRLHCREDTFLEPSYGIAHATEIPELRDPL